MSRGNRRDQFRPDEVAVVHVMNRVAGRAMLLGQDPITGKCYDHRKGWIDAELLRLTAGFAIDLVASAILGNHFHLVLRSRPDIVALWNATEIAMRWLTMCPTPNMRRSKRGPTEKELDSIRKVPSELARTRLQLSDISWFTRLMSQRIAQRANAEDDTVGHFWADRFNSVCLVDAEAILACAVYVDLNIIRAAIARTIEVSLHSSIKCRIDAMLNSLQAVDPDADSGLDEEELGEVARARLPDSHLAPVQLAAEPGAYPSCRPWRCSDKGYANMTNKEYIDLVDWTARMLVDGKRGSTPVDAPPVLERLGISAERWTQFTEQFDERFTPYTGLHPCEAKADDQAETVARSNVQPSDKLELTADGDGKPESDVKPEAMRHNRPHHRMRRISKLRLAAGSND